jgi:phage-related protein
MVSLDDVWNMLVNMYNTIQSIFNTLSSITAKLNDIWVAITNLPNTIANAVSDLKDYLTGSISGLIQQIGSLRQWISDNIMSWFDQGISGVINSAVSFFTNGINGVRDWFLNAMQQVGAMGTFALPAAVLLICSFVLGIYIVVWVYERIPVVG